MPIAKSRAPTRPAKPKDARLVHTIYELAPGYFDVISIPMPSEDEVARELEAASHDPLRHTELIYASHRHEEGGIPDPDCPQSMPIIGYLDYKLDYPDKGDATVNLLLIPEHLQNRGHGKRTVRTLEARLKGRVKRILVSIYGKNPRAKRFWGSLGYRFAIDAKPLLDWYAKELTPR